MGRKVHEREGVTDGKAAMPHVVEWLICLGCHAVFAGHRKENPDPCHWCGATQIRPEIDVPYLKGTVH